MRLVFALVDHSGEAAKVGMKMPPTKLLIFGNPKGGTPLMLAAPSIALDLPVKNLSAGAGLSFDDSLTLDMSTGVAYIGNRYWTYKERDSGGSREVVLFLAINGIAIAIQTGITALTYYVMHLDSHLEIFFSKFVLGIGIGMAFRFWCYRSFIFPEGEVPAPMPSANGTLEGVPVPLADFMQLTKIPIVIYFGDNIPDEPTTSPGEDNWRVRLAMARLWRDAVNRRGGDVTLVHLPELGIRGNTHFPFSDLNNLQIADLMSEFLRKKALD